MKIIALYIIYFVLVLIFTDHVVLQGWDWILLLGLTLSAFLYGIALGEKETK